MSRLGIVISGAVALMLAGCDGGSSDADDGPDLREEAEAMVRMDDAYDFCTDAVRDRLRSPGTAEFSDRREQQDGTLYRFTGVVDSENGYGALLRSDFACEIRWTGSDFTAVTVAVI